MRTSGWSKIAPWRTKLIKEGYIAEREAAKFMGLSLAQFIKKVKVEDIQPYIHPMNLHKFYKKEILERYMNVQ